MRPFGSGSQLKGLHGVAAVLLALVATAGPARSEAIPLPSLNMVRLVETGGFPL